MEEANGVSSQHWHKMSLADKTSLVHKALTDQARLSAAIQTLSTLSTKTSSDWRTDVLSTLKRSANGIQDFFSAFLATTFYTERHLEGASTGPHEFFGVPELVQRTLGFLSCTDLFRARQVNRALRSTIERSDYLRAQMHIRSNLERPFVTAFENYSECAELTGFTCEVIFAWNTALFGIEKAPGTYAIALEVRYDASLSRVAVPSRSYAYRSMFICQPPPMEMVVFPNCCSRYTYSSLRGAGMYLKHLQGLR